MTTLDDLRKTELRTRRSITRRWSAERALADRIIAHYLRAFDTMSGTRAEKRWHEAVNLLTARAFNSIRSAHESLLRGYPTAAMILARTIDEDVLTAMHIFDHPGDARFWLAKKYSGRRYLSGRRIPAFEKMRQSLDWETAERGRDFYRVLSQFAHPRAGGLRFLKQWDGEARHFRVGPVDDDRLTLLAYEHLLSVAVSGFALPMEFVSRADPSWVDEAAALFDSVYSWWASKQEDVMDSDL